MSSQKDDGNRDSGETQHTPVSISSLRSKFEALSAVSSSTKPTVQPPDTSSRPSRESHGVNAASAKPTPLAQAQAPITSPPLSAPRPTAPAPAASNPLTLPLFLGPGGAVRSASFKSGQETSIRTLADPTQASSTLQATTPPAIPTQTSVVEPKRAEIGGASVARAEAPDPLIRPKPIDSAERALYGLAAGDLEEDGASSAAGPSSRPSRPLVPAKPKSARLPTDDTSAPQEGGRSAGFSEARRGTGTGLMTELGGITITPASPAIEHPEQTPIVLSAPSDTTPIRPTSISADGRVKRAAPPAPPPSRSRAPSPKPPEPSRATKPIPRVSPQPSPSISREPSSSDLATTTSLSSSIKPSLVGSPPPPSLPARKATLPPGEGLSRAPPPLPANKPTSTSSTTQSLAIPNTRSSGSSSSIPPLLPDRPRSGSSPSQMAPPISLSRSAPQTQPGLPPRLPTRQATLATTSPSKIPDKAFVARRTTVTARAETLASASSPPKRIDSRNSIEQMLDEERYQPPPPPIRNASAIATGIATPPRRAASVACRRQPSQDHSDEGEDEDDDEGGAMPAITTQAQRMLDDYPDSTLANRRPPSFVPNVKINATHHIYSFAAHGRYVCTGAHHVKVYDTLMSNSPLIVVDLKDTGLHFRIKEPVVTAMGFRPAQRLADDGRYLWCGTKDGHLWELDIKTGEVTDIRQGAHGSAVVQIFRYQTYFMTLEENGKLHVFNIPHEDPDNPDSNSSSSIITRTVRIAERFTFAKLLSRKLWTATAPINRSTTNTSSPGPCIRVYEPCAPGSIPTPKAVYTSEWTGAVMDATVLPLDPSKVFLGHEGGYVSIWSAEDVTCLQVLKISSSDILALQGVGDKLWTGNRKGQIHVYDISNRPWQTTNMWTAHPDYPITALNIDFRAIEDSGRLTVWSACRDSLRAWDGLLSVDWIDTEMTARQSEYCTYRDIKVLICTYNIDSAKPTDIYGHGANGSFLNDLFNSVESPDLIIFGFQEVIPLTDKKLTAKTLLFGGKGKEATNGGDKVTMAYRHWIDKLTSSVRAAFPDEPYVKIHSENLVGLLTCAFAKSREQDNLRGLDITSVKRGIGGIYGNKGAIVARLVLDDTSLCFINVHLAAGQRQKASRNADLAGIMEDKAILPPHDTMPFVRGGDGTGILDHEMVFLSGDLNYRIDQRREVVLSSVSGGELDFLIEHDQLKKEMRSNHAFRLRTFEEAPITFEPTYKYNPNSHDYDSSDKMRIPAWCDRILHNKTPNIENLSYQRYETTMSDHRPVSAGFRVRIKAIDAGRMKESREVVGKLWRKQEKEVLERIMAALPDIL